MAFREKVIYALNVTLKKDCSFFNPIISVYSSLGLIVIMRTRSSFLFERL
ncbi:hypothetical protein CASFOL_002010 [Castilleja foliolosa]|uniref:Uncharacterized protein n=1 Tax=Castilleja foliolosa TaxID=1961234 RepID=A0ABD3EGM2_9LAMI